MIPIVTPREMAEVDAAASVPVDQLIERAGSAVAWAARRYLGGVYGHRIVVVAGPGNNGADGRVAARRLRSWGASVVDVEPGADATPPGASLVIDAAYGTGLSRPYVSPATEAPVLAVDIASGINGLTGEVSGRPSRADLTVTFQALKPGLLFPPGAGFAGTVSVVDLGLDVSSARAHLLEAADVTDLLPHRSSDDHKWRSACWVVAGSPGMTGAAQLAASAAARSGAGYVRLSIPGCEARGVVEVVGHELAPQGWASELTDSGRFGAFVVGPGLGRSSGTRADVAAVAAMDVPTVLDGDALWGLADSFGALRGRTVPAVLTPHDGEFETLTGARPGPDRIDAARSLSAESGSVVDRPRWWQLPTDRCLSPTPAMPALPPPARATCSLGSSARCWLGASRRFERLVLAAGFTVEPVPSAPNMEWWPQTCWTHFRRC